MRIPKIYGQSKANNCPFCGKEALIKNSQEVPVCLNHKHKELLDLKCVCGELLDLKIGKWGPYFNCLNCGNISFSKGIGMNPDLGKKENNQCETKNNKENKQISIKSLYKSERETKKEMMKFVDEFQHAKNGR